MFLLFGVLWAAAGRAAPAEVHPWAGLGSLVIPGLGQVAQDRAGTAAVHGGVWLGSGLGAGAFMARDTYLEPGDRADEDRQILYYNRASYYADTLNTVSFNTQLYSAYDAYYGGEGESAATLLAAPFQPDYLTRATTWLPLALRAALLFDGGANDWAVVTDDSISRAEIGAVNAARYEAVAVGEEAFFRGVANEQLVRSWGTWPGVLASSTLFGLAHSGQMGTANKVGAGLYGVYLGGLHVRNDFRLGEGVAIHFWWNFLTALDYLKNGTDDGEGFPVVQLGGRF
ncbi:MAG TPA: CPBP family intramembrane glutamic endopeptidase [Gammaproteobacteria bacterium]|nr:CPBP family intramembrane glutamic endopeptidase [Gammaproteobacteria bacterium]